MKYWMTFYSRNGQFACFEEGEGLRPGSVASNRVDHIKIPDCLPLRGIEKLGDNFIVNSQAAVYLVSRKGKILRQVRFPWWSNVHWAYPIDEKEILVTCTDQEAVVRVGWDNKLKDVIWTAEAYEGKPLDLKVKRKRTASWHVKDLHTHVNHAKLFNNNEVWISLYIQGMTIVVDLASHSILKKIPNDYAIHCPLPLGNDTMWYADSRGQRICHQRLKDNEILTEFPTPSWSKCIRVVGFDIAASYDFHTSAHTIPGAAKRYKKRKYGRGGVIRYKKDGTSYLTPCGQRVFAFVQDT